MPPRRRIAVLAVITSLAATAPIPALATSKPQTARQRATAQCKAEQKRLGTQAFHDRYGVHSTKSALAKCVSKRLKQNKNSRG